MLLCMIRICHSESEFIVADLSRDLDDWTLQRGICIDPVATDWKCGWVGSTSLAGTIGNLTYKIDTRRR